MQSSSFIAQIIQLFIIFLSHTSTQADTTATYLPLAYTIQSGQEECLYERITERNEHLTSSVFVLSGEELQAAIVFEGPVAPVDLDLSAKPTGKSSAGAQLKQYLTRYDAEGTDMFIHGKFGDSMLNVKPYHLTQLIDFEGEEEDFYDDYRMNDREREEFNKHHDLEHQHRAHNPPPHEAPKHPAEQQRREQEHHDGGEDPTHDEEIYGDDYFLIREEQRRERLREEAQLDDDFVKLQMNHERHARPEMDNEGPRRRNIHQQQGGADTNHRRLREEPNPGIKLLAGEPYQKTIQVESPGWYRLCVHPKSHTIEVEMELRKSSTFGKLDPRTGHVPELGTHEIHTEIRALFDKEDDEIILAEEGAIKDEDLSTSKEQLRILEKVYADIISKQLEERRVWNWRTIKNQHLHSHLVLGNLVETIVYMAITGWQVYTIRKWFGGDPSLGR